MNIDLALDTLGDLPFEMVLIAIKKIKDENKRLRERDKRMLNRFDECIDLLNSHHKLNKELRETSEEKTKEISELTSTNQNLSVIEQVRKFILIDQEFSIENSMMTPSMKVRRFKVKEKYKDQLESLY